MNALIYILLLALIVPLGPDASVMLWGSYTFAMIIPAVCAAVRRLHDCGGSGAWILLLLLPHIGPLALAFMLIRDPVRGANQYGPQPMSRRVRR